MIQQNIDMYSDTKQIWEMIKMGVRGSSIQFCSRKHKSRQVTLVALEQKLFRVEKQQAENFNLFNDCDEQKAILNAEIEKIYQHKAQGARLRCQANWVEGGEKCTAYFSSFENHNKNKRTINRLRASNGEIIDDHKQIMDIQKASNLANNKF